MTPAEMRAAHPLISTAPQYKRYLAAKAAREIVGRITAPITANVTGLAPEKGNEE